MTSDVEKVYKSKVPRAPVKAQYSRSRAPHPHLTCYSPFRVRDAIRDMRPLPPIAVQESREREYVVDAVKSDVVRFSTHCYIIVSFFRCYPLLHRY